jgi:3-oxosteroid 1-dehydrogenase
MAGDNPEHWDPETDIVAIGSGNGGLSAAITAREYGVEAVVLERFWLLSTFQATRIG